MEISTKTYILERREYDRVQYVPCSEEEQGHLQCTCLFGSLSWTLSTLRVGLPYYRGNDGSCVAFESLTDSNTTAPSVVESW